MNSTIISWFYRQISAVFRGGYLRWIYQYLIELPVPKIDETNPKEVAVRDKIIALVDQMLSLKAKEANHAGAPHEAAQLKRQIDATDREIDLLVYELYGLTEDEIKIVERKE